MIQTEIKAQRSFVDPFYKVEYKGSYFLSAQIGRDGLYLAVLDLKNNTYQAAEEFIFEGVQNPFQLKNEFEKRIESSALLKASFDKVLFSVINEHSSLIPDALYDGDKKQDYFELTLGHQEDVEVHVDSLINAKSKNVFAVPLVFKESLIKYFPNAMIRHFSTPLVDGMTLNYKQREGEYVVLHVQYSHFEVLYFKNGILQFYNSFNYTTAEDFIYYTLFAFEQLELNPEKIPVTLYGEVDKDSSIYNLLYKYVRFVEFGQRPKMLNYSTAFDVLFDHHYFNLFQQFLCV